MTDLETMREREREASRALEGLRVAATTLPAGHPATAPLADALAIAERYHRETKEALSAAECDQPRQHPEDYWASRWRT